jgi:hypothetical protein
MILKHTWFYRISASKVEQKWKNYYVDVENAAGNTHIIALGREGGIEGDMP